MQEALAAPSMDDFEAMLEETMADENLSEGSVVKGKVIAIENGQAIIDVGFKMEGRVDIKEFAPPGKPADIEVGDEVIDDAIHPFIDPVDLSGRERPIHQTAQPSVHRRVTQQQQVAEEQPSSRRHLGVRRDVQQHVTLFLGTGLWAGQDLTRFLVPGEEPLLIEPSVLNRTVVADRRSHGHRVIEKLVGKRAAPWVEFEQDFGHCGAIHDPPSRWDQHALYTHQ
jgi:hypothetical protein